MRTAKRVAEDYDVLQEQKDGFERVPERSLSLVDADRRVRWVSGDNWDEWSSDPVREITAVVDEHRGAGA